MGIWDKFRIKQKIKKICKVLYRLSKSDQRECMQIVICCLRMADDWRMKERFLDMVLEGFNEGCL